MKQFNAIFFSVSMIFLFFLSSIQLNAQSDGEIRGLWLFNIAYGTSWENEDAIETFTIGVFSNNDEFNAIAELAKDRTIHDKTVKVVKCEEYAEIPDCQIVYVTKNENAYLGFVYEQFKGKNVLIFSDRSHQEEYSVINFRDIADYRKFDLNTYNGSIQKLKFSNQLIKLGGNREDLMALYSKTNNKLKELQSDCSKKDQKIKELEDEINKLKQKNEKLK